MASSGDPNRPVVEPFTKEQRQRLEAAQFAKRLIGREYNEPKMSHSEQIGAMLRVADWIVTGDR